MNIRDSWYIGVLFCIVTMFAATGIQHGFYWHHNPNLDGPSDSTEELKFSSRIVPRHDRRARDYDVMLAWNN